MLAVMQEKNLWERNYQTQVILYPSLEEGIVMYVFKR